MLEQLTYELGPENIAAEPRDVRLGSRDLGRMLVVDRAARSFRDSRVLDLADQLARGDVLVLNNSKRLPGVLKVRVSAGAQVELRVVELKGDRTFTARAYPLHYIKSGTRLSTAAGAQLHVTRTDLSPHALCELEAEASIVEILRSEGLPITSFFYRDYWQIDHYNPIYAENEGSVESPLAGLHFTERLLSKFRAAGILVVPLTLHVVGSWLPPLLETDVGHEESYYIPRATADAINKAHSEGRRVVPVGSTSMRAIESASMASGQIDAGPGRSTLLLKPGAQFKAADAYFTNFHQAQSSLMMLDAAFCGTALVLEAYRYAQRSGYLFHEFGDAVLYV